MATILLQAAGAFLGGVLGPVGTAIGSAAGALAGYAIDRALIDSTRHMEGPRLTGARPFTAEEGASIPRVYGAARLGGTLIWATHFEETRTTKRQGSKGGARVTEYSYFANVAFALCEGEIAGIRRIWADGREIDRNNIEIRIYRGTQDQQADPLIEAKQGSGNVPAYRGLAYVVLDRFALGEYGNRIPQFQFEILRPVGETAANIRAISLIPGATEYGLSPELVTRQKRPGETEAENRHVLFADTNLTASLDELQMLCPNLEHIALVATWYGDDLRAGNCKIRPGVTSRFASGFSETWRASGIGREAAMLISSIDGSAAYGGTPSDRSIISAIREIKARGIKVTLYPFIMMDIGAGNSLPDPYGNVSQAVYPWRGRVTAHPAPMRPGTADKTAAARAQVSAFCGVAQRDQFAASGGTILFSGAADDWGYRRFVLHFAHLARAAGGIDAFLIGTELRGLTTLRDQGGRFPFVEALCALAADTREILGPKTSITYGADWSEYFGHQPADGSGDVCFHLDALWSHPAIDAIGIDNYMPLSDWRDSDHSSSNPDGFSSIYDAASMSHAIAHGEGYDWYYASEDARRQRARSPISDGAHGKPWVYRYKDLVNWWSNPHFDRVAGQEVSAPSGWVPCSKPIWFTELGCPAVDKGPNQPNVFPDPKSAESAAPYFSNGGRSDLAQQRFLDAHFRHWDPASPAFKTALNPVSPVYGRRMVEPSRIYLWAWDARPFPAFPLRKDIWADGDNWQRGHWLNGRLQSPGIGALVNRILADHGLPPADVANADGTVHGYVISDPGTARSALEPIIELFDLTACEEAGRLVFRSRTSRLSEPVEIEDLVVSGNEAVIETVRMPDHELPVEGILAFRDPLNDYQAVSARNVRFGAPGSRQQTISFPGVMETGQGKALLENWMQRIWSERETVTFSVAAERSDIVPGVVVRLASSVGSREFLVTGIEDGLARKVAARQLVRSAPLPWQSETLEVRLAVAQTVGQPYVQFLDLPSASGGAAAQDQFRIAIWQKPWKSQLLFASPEETGFSQRALVSRPAQIGHLLEPLSPGFEGRVDHAGSIVVELFDAEVASVSRLQMLNGANAAAIRSANGAWEIAQFQTAEEIAPGVWKLGGLLRGQLGTGDAAASGASAGASFVILDDAVQPAGLLANEIGLPLNWRAGPAGSDFSSANFATQPATGGLRAQLPLSPVHLRATRRRSGDVSLSWVRRGRVDADNWAASEIPLGEEREQYQVEIAKPNGARLRTVTVAEPTWLYPAASISADLGVAAGEIDVTVRQLSVAVGWGIPTTRRFALD